MAKRISVAISAVAPNNSFKPNLFRYGKSVAIKACHDFSSTAQVGLIQALGLMKSISAVLAAVLLITSCSMSEGSNEDRALGSPAQSNLNSEACLSLPAKPQAVAISALIANPERFEGAAVTVFGFYHSDFEHSAIYPTERDPTPSTWQDGLWINGVSPFSSIGGESLIVTGIFSSKDKGHLGQWPGSICVASIALAPRHEP